jgi:hypothetical protein
MSIPNVGEFATAEQLLREMPVGALVYDEEEDVLWTRTAEGWRDSDDSFFSTIGQGEGEDAGRWRVNFLPVVVPPETLAQYQWRYADICFTGAERHSVSFDEVVDALSDMGYHQDDYPIGPGMQIRSYTMRNSLPDGSIVMKGDPENWWSFGVFCKVNNGWRHVLGGNGALVVQQAVWVVEMNGSRQPAPWVTETPTAKDAEAIRAFKRTAYEVGMNLKSEHEWCPTYDAIVAEAGISREVLDERS